jgi:hypothetical protein
MSREIPEPVRAAAGLAATVLDEVRKLPETLPGLPVRAVGLAMQAALKLQQEYAGLVARGDEVFTGIRGESEPGMATFDDELDEPAAPPTQAGFRDSAFDRAEAPADVPDTGEVMAAADAAPADQADAVDLAPLAEPADEALEDMAIEDLVDAAPAGPVDAGADSGAVENALLENEAATATDEGGSDVAAATGAGTDGGGTDSGGSDTSRSPAAGTAPIDGYDDFSIAQLRGRLRGYAPSTVEALLAYEEATRAREPYARMLRNRLERLTADEVAASPLAPRGV